MDILATCWTTAGNVRPTARPDVSPWPFEDRVHAAAVAGFTGFGIGRSDLVVARDRLGYPTMAKILEDAGMTFVEIEAVMRWINPERQASFDKEWSVFAEAAEHLAPGHIKATGDLTGTSWPVEMMAERFALLCRRADELGTRMLIELMPMSSLRTLQTGIDVVGDSTGGLLLDSWHVFRGAMDLQTVASLPPGLIGHVELDDAAAGVEGTLFDDTFDRRLLPGEGALDLHAFLNAVHSAGYRGAFGVEIISEVHRHRSLDDATRLAYDTTARLLAAAHKKG
jgi:sugar phosphate isomerase/epimerase